MKTETIINDFPKNKLKNLFLEADEILVIQPPQLDLSLMTEGFLAGLAQGLRQKFLEKLKRPKVILCTLFPDLFQKDSDIDKVIKHQDYVSFLKQHSFQKQNLLVVDLTNDKANKFLFEFDRMVKWPIKQKPFFSQLTFHWENLPQGSKAENSLSNRYLLLIEQIFGKSFFIKPRFPKVSLPSENNHLYLEIVSKCQLEPLKYRQIILWYSGENEVQKINPNKLLEIADSLHKKKRGLEITILIDQKAKHEAWVNPFSEKVRKKKGLGIIFPRRYHVFSLEDNQVFSFLQKQNLIIGPNDSLIQLANALQVKTISLCGPLSRHFISNYRWNNFLYADCKICEYLQKTDTWLGKGYIASCYNKNSCLSKGFCLSQITTEKIVEKALEVL